MADEQINQDEIEQLLKQAQGAANPAPAAKPDPAKEKSADADISLDQSEIEQLIAGAPSTETPPPPRRVRNEGMGSDVEVLLSKAQEALASIDQNAEDLPPGMKPFALADLNGTPATTEAATLELVRDVQLDLKIELGRTHMHLEDVLRLKSGAVVPLDKLAGDPVDILVNGRLIARGEVLVLNDNFCVRVTELVVGDSAVA